MVQGAVYDAVNAIVGGYQPYLPDLPAASPSASQEAAVATAAHDVLVGLGIGTVPPLPQVVRDRLDALYAAALAAIPDGDAKTEGVAAGAAAAAAMLHARADDGRFAPAVLWPDGTVPGEWRPDLPAFANAFAWVAQVEPFTLESTSQFRTKGPNALTSGAYAKDYNEVKDLGAARQSPHSRADCCHQALRGAPAGAVQPHIPGDIRSAGTHARRGSPTLRHVEPGHGGQCHQLLRRQGVLELLAPDHRDPRGRQ